jgi:hypothetical protein
VTVQDLDDAILRQHAARCFADSGYLCRNLLGWNYDKDENGEVVNKGSGGIRQDGAHAKMVAFVDDPNIQFGLLEAPRGSFKSTLLQGLCVRMIGLNPNIRILYGMKTDEKAVEQASAIQRALQMPEVVALIGDQRGDPARDGRTWESWRFTVAGRTKQNLMEPTFRTFTLESIPTGGHYDLIIADDLIDAESVKSDTAMENANKVVRLLFPLRDKGARTLFVGTRYGDGDIYSELERNPLYKKLILKAGVRVVQTTRGNLDLEVGPDGLTFPHLTLAHLRKALHAMTQKGNWFDFSCQYLNEVPVGLTTPFRREMLKPVTLAPHEMTLCSGYLLTDTATSTKQQGCYSVIGYVLLDEAEQYHLVDLRVGHWRPVQFMENYFQVLQHWQTRCNHRGEVWEDVAMATLFKFPIDEHAKRNQIRQHVITVPRHGADVMHKRHRILRLEAMFRTGRFFVNTNTVPRLFIDLDGERELWNPEGYKDPRTGVPLPSGELVDEFIRLGAAGVKQDIADMLGMLMENDKETGKPACVYRRPRTFGQDTGLPQQHGQHDVYPVPHHAGLVDWWDRTLREQRS